MSTPTRPDPRTGPPGAQPSRAARLAQAADRTGLRVPSTVAAAFVGWVLILLVAPAPASNAQSDTLLALAVAAWGVAIASYSYARWFTRDAGKVLDALRGAQFWGLVGAVFLVGMQVTAVNAPISGPAVVVLQVVLAITGTVALATWAGRVFTPDQQRVPE